MAAGGFNSDQRDCISEPIVLLVILLWTGELADQVSDRGQTSAEHKRRMETRLEATFPWREGGRLGIRQGKDAQEQERLAALRVLRA